MRINAGELLATKYKELPEFRHRDDDIPVATLSLDATRRLVISQANANSSTRFTCPEPPPDAALSTLSQEVQALKTKGLDASNSTTYEALVQALHARTSTVEFWRTTSSMYCVLLMNGQTTQAESYLAAARASIGTTKDTVVALPAASTFQQAVVEAALNKAKEEAAKEQALKEEAQKTRLKDAKAACEKVPADKKEADAHCALIKAEAMRLAAESSLKASGEAP